MANTLLTSSIIQKEALMILQNELTFTKNVNKEYSDAFGKSGAKIGATVNARKPPRYVGRSGQALQVEASTENYVPITLDTQFGVDISFSTADLTLHIDEFAARFLKPAMATIANKVDYDGLQLYKDINRYVNAGAGSSTYGTSGTLNGGSATVAQVQGQILTAGAILTESGVPIDSRGLVLDPLSQVSAATPMLALFNPQARVSSIFEKGSIGASTLGFDWAADANVGNFVPMAAGSVTALTAAPASGASAIAVTTTAGTVPKGTIATIAGVFAINPQNRQSTGRLMQFVVTADTAVTTTGTLPVYPAYIPSGQFATCSGTPTATAAVNILASGAIGGTGSSQNLAFHKDAFTLATADLILPQGVDMSERANYNGISMRMVRQYDINSDMMPCRFDILYGFKTVYPELAVRVGG
jgi:hypothetical protein